MSCNDYRDLLLDYEHGELDAASDAQVFEHLQLCPDCKAQWQEDLALTEGLRTAFATATCPSAEPVAKSWGKPLNRFVASTSMGLR